MEIPMSVAIETQTSLEKYFSTFRAEVIGDGETIETPFGQHRLIYADWTASGRMYRPIEDRLSREIAPFVANTHTETNTTGRAMTHAYHRARQIIKSHVGAWETDVLISANSGMTGVVNKFQRILGLRVHERYHQAVLPSGTDRPIVFVSHMEHHSNQTSWLETLADVEIIQPTADGLVDLDSLRSLLARYADRTIKIAAVTSCSNVTGIKTPYHEIAEMMHRAGGLCFVDFACSAPYIDICMRPENPLQHLDAIYFSWALTEFWSVSGSCWKSYFLGFMPSRIFMCSPASMKIAWGLFPSTSKDCITTSGSSCSMTASAFRPAEAAHALAPTDTICSKCLKNIPPPSLTSSIGAINHPSPAGSACRSIQSCPLKMSFTSSMPLKPSVQTSENGPKTTRITISPTNSHSMGKTILKKKLLKIGSPAH
jgi:hypothetical protein